MPLPKGRPPGKVTCSYELTAKQRQHHGVLAKPVLVQSSRNGLPLSSLRTGDNAIGYTRNAAAYEPDPDPIPDRWIAKD
jgi:hypothetical protein